jgi:hypothetical protein
MFAMIRRFCGFSEPEHRCSSSHRLDTLCSARSSRPALSYASQVTQLADASAPSAHPAAAGDQAADWVELRRIAGWQALESKPDGRHLLEEASEVDHLRHSCPSRIADQGSTIVEAPLAAPVLDLTPADCAPNNVQWAMHSPENLSAVAAAGRVHATAPALLQPAAPPSILEDRRAARRYSAGQVHRPFTIMEGFCNSPAVLRDISITGVKLVLRVQYRLSASLQVTIISKGYGIIGPLQAQVVRLVPLADGRWLTSCVFDDPFDHEWLKTLIRNG